MKLLHTSDWHLGNQLYGYDRSDEHQAMLDDIVRIAIDEKPDLFLLCGDIFHTAHPSASTQKMFVDAMYRLRTSLPDTAIVTIAGNHDSGKGHEIFHTLWKAVDIHALGEARKGERIDDLIIEIPGKFIIAAIPYFPERFFPQDYIKSVVEKAVEKSGGECPVIVAAHLAVAGCDFTGHDSEENGIYIGGLGALSADRIGKGYQYCALGHIHRPQSINSPDSGAVRYSGSPLPVGFDESYSHSVTIVEIDGEGISDIRERHINPLRELVTIPASGFLPWEDVMQLLEDYDGPENAYIRLNVSLEQPLPKEAPHMAAYTAEKHGCRFCLINPFRKAVERGDVGDKRFPADYILKKSSPVEIARRYMTDIGNNLSEDSENLLREVIDIVNEENRNNEIPQ